MAFDITKSTVLITTTSTGVYMGTSIADLSTHYEVKAVHVRLGASTSADLYVSYDAGASWALHGSYDVALDAATTGTEGTAAAVCAAAEAQIKALEEFSA